MKATERGCVAIIKKNDCKFIYEGETYPEGILNNNLYEVITVNLDSTNVPKISCSCKSKNCATI